MFNQLNTPILGIVENMSYYLCPNCGDRSEIFAHGGARLEAEKLGLEFLGEIPLDIVIRETSDGGRPIVVSDPDNAHAKAYMAIARRIWEKLDQDQDAARPAAPKIVIQ
jgi:ATP-binding protein involved in chromosome partitioning